jgi:hypothetical protein
MMKFDSDRPAPLSTILYAPSTIVQNQVWQLKLLAGKFYNNHAGYLYCNFKPSFVFVVDATIAL